MTIEERLTQFEERQEAIIQAIMGLTDCVEMQRDKITELMEWLQQPAPPSEAVAGFDAILDVLKAHGTLIEAVALR
jgi:hypothetical protein